MALPALLAGLGAVVASGAGSMAAAAGNAAGDLALLAFNVGKILLRGSLFLAAVTAFIVVLNLAISGFGVALNQSVINDLMGMIQMWSPFNINSIFIWITTAGFAYITYRIVLAGIVWFNRVLGQ